jgi:hypothetical protein
VVSPFRDRDLDECPLPGMKLGSRCVTVIVWPLPHSPGVSRGKTLSRL